MEVFAGPFQVVDLSLDGDRFHVEKLNFILDQLFRLVDLDVELVVFLYIFLV